AHKQPAIELHWTDRTRETFSYTGFLIDPGPTQIQLTAPDLDEAAQGPTTRLGRYPAGRCHRRGEHSHRSSCPEPRCSGWAYRRKKAGSYAWKIASDLLWLTLSCPYRSCGLQTITRIAAHLATAADLR